MMHPIKFVLAASLLASVACNAPAVADHHKAAEHTIMFEGKDGPGKGKHVVLVAGDEEYRSEEALPQLAKILAERHGFTCTVVFSVNPETGEIDPNNQKNIPGLAALGRADLMVIATRFRNLPDADMKHIDDFLKAGKPVIGLRTATHAFNMKGSKNYQHYSNGYGGKEHPEWKGGFGRLVLGEKWISHHGGHKREGCRGIIAPDAKGHPINKGIKDGDVWGPSDVYGVRLPLPGDSKPLVLGQVQKNVHHDGKDRWFGMKPTDPPLEGKKNDPMMPVAWIKSYELPGGKKGTAFTTTMGAATDFESEGLRRLFVNATYHLVGLDVPEKANVDTIGKFEPSAYGFNAFVKGKKPSDYK